jgi:hypothetical protein
MFATIVDVLVSLMGVHALLKFAILLFVPYTKRRSALDRSYGNKPMATRVGDTVLLMITIALSGLVLWRGIEATSFLSGLWIGATLIQVYFHRFHEPLADDLAPPPVVSPIKMMSYAIQAAPRRPWREMLLMTVLIVWSLVLICERNI